MIYLLTAMGLPPGDSSTVHIYTPTIHRTTQNKQYIERQKNVGRVLAVPAGYTLAFILQVRKKHGKASVKCSSRVPAGTMKIHKHTIRIYRHSNKNV
jgi:hypothetical protein